MTSVAATQFLPVASTATMSSRSLVVSVHDVAPATWETTKKILTELQEQGVRACSLLVVPDYHHTGPSMEDRAFVSALRELEDAGHEIVIHGFFHQRPRKSGETVSDQFITRVYTQDEGEFYDLSYDEALRRITQAREQFELAGLRPHGFVAPAWLLGSEAERGAGDAGMEYTTRLTSITDLRSGDVFHARSLVYSVRNQWRRSVSLGWNALVAQLSKNNSLVRLSIHPVDYNHPTIWKQVRQLVDGMQSDRTPTTYHDWIVERRIRRSSGV